MGTKNQTNPPNKTEMISPDSSNFSIQNNTNPPSENEMMSSDSSQLSNQNKTDPPSESEMIVSDSSQLGISLSHAVNSIVNTIPSLFKCVGAALSCSVCVHWFSAPSCFSSCTIITVGLCVTLLGESIALTTRAILNFDDCPYGDDDDCDFDIDFI